MTSSPAHQPAAARDMPIYKRDHIRFTCGDEATLTGVKRVSRYESFNEMFDHESAAAINPTADRTEQLRAIRDIYSQEKEALGVLAIEIEKS